MLLAVALALAAFLGDSYPFAASASLHRVEASFGWEHVFGEHFLVRWDLGASYTLSAEADVVHDFNPPALFDPFFAAVEAKANHELESVLEKYVHIPILAVGVGWRFQSLRRARPPPRRPCRRRCTC